MGKLQEPMLGKFARLVRISNSEMQTFKRCKRRWWLGYYRGLQPIEKSGIGPLPLGTRIHDALEQYYTDGTHPVDAYNRLHRRDAKLFMASKEATFEDNVDKFNKESELGRIMLEGYMEWLEETNEDAKIEVVGAEQILTYRLTEFDPRVELIGKVDLKVQRAFDKAVAIFDHKSAAASNYGDYLQYAQMSEQLMMYVLLERLNRKEGEPRVDGGTYNVLKKVRRTGRATPPFYDRVDVSFNTKTLQSFYIRLLGTVRDIMSTRDALDNGEDHRFVAYPTQKMDWTCGTCPFYKICPMFDDGSAVEMMVDDYYVQGDPNARYDDQDQIKESI